jgi:hypothetical protein
LRNTVAVVGAVAAVVLAGGRAHNSTTAALFCPAVAAQRRSFSCTGGGHAPSPFITLLSFSVFAHVTECCFVADKKLHNEAMQLPSEMRLRQFQRRVPHKIVHSGELEGTVGVNVAAALQE